MSNILADQYLKVFSSHKDSYPEITPKIITEPLNQLHISAEHLTEAIDELSFNAAAGPDNFPAVFLKKWTQPRAVGQPMMR